MANNFEPLNKISNDVKRLENQLKYRKLYNARNRFVNLLLKSGIVLDYALPFILAAVITSFSFRAMGEYPFYAEEVTENARIETIDTSTGFHIEHISYDFNYKNESIEHSTGWIKNNELYERTVTSYRIDDKIDISDIDKILSMSKEEIEKLLVVTSISVIHKADLMAEDHIYDSDAIVVINHDTSETEIIVRPETLGWNIYDSGSFILIVVILGLLFTKLENCLIKRKIRDILREYEPLFIQTNKKEAEKLKKVLKIKKENLLMLKDDLENIKNSDGQSYSLRRT